VSAVGSLRRTLAGAALVASSAMAACETGPGGPATVSATVTGAADLGAVVLDVVWPGIQGFEGRGSTQVYSAPVEGEEDRHRVILVGPAGGDLGFGILVDDVYLEGPVVEVVEATDSANDPRPVDDLRVALER